MNLLHTYAVYAGPNTLCGLPAHQTDERVTIGAKSFAHYASGDFVSRHKPCPKCVELLPLVQLVETEL